MRRAPLARRVSILTCMWLSVASVSAAAHPGSSERLATLTQLLASAPTDTALRLARAHEYRELGHLREALADVNAALRGGKTPEALTERARVQLARGRVEAAGSDLDAALRLRSDWAEARVERARLRLMGNPGLERKLAARADLDVAIAVLPTPEVVIERLRIDEGLRDLDAARAGLIAALDRIDAVVLGLELVRIERLRGDTNGALAAVDRLLIQRPSHPGWILIRGEILAGAGDIELAHLHFSDALDQADRELLKRPSVTRLLWRARALAGLGRTTEARESVARALAIAPEHGEALAFAATLP